MLKGDYNTEESVASVKNISSLIPTLQKINIDTIRVVNNTYPCEREDMSGKCEKDMWEDKSFINLSGLGQTLNKIDSEVHEGSRPTSPSTQEQTKVTEDYNCKGPTRGKKVETRT